MRATVKLVALIGGGWREDSLAVGGGLRILVCILEERKWVGLCVDPWLLPGVPGGYLWVAELMRSIWVWALHEERGGVLYLLLNVIISS